MNDPAVILALHSLLVHSILAWVEYYGNMTIRCSRPIVSWSKVKAAIWDHHIVITQTFTLV